MTDKKPQPKKISLANTKQEMLSAYNELVKQLEERREAELKPQEKIEEKTRKQVVEVADSLSTEGVVGAVGTLKSEMGKLLVQLSDKLEGEVNKYKQIKAAVEAKENELGEIYEIQKSASSLAALIEAQEQKRQEFEAEMAARKEELTREIQTLRADWEKEKKLHEAEIKERDGAEAKRREREKEEYLYTFRREQQSTKDQFEDEKAKLEREVQYKREQMERELAERERTIAQKEEELSALREKVGAFPKEVESAVSKAVREAVERVQLEAKNREELLRKEFEGERNVLNARIEALEKTVKEQNGQIAKLSGQLEKSYGQVQDIAVKAIEGSSHSGSLASLQHLVAEQTRKQPQEK
jgi:chromosome segregation ATPase